MFTQAIDSVQNAKKQVVETFVSDKATKSELIKLVDAQTTFYKGWVNSTISLAQTLVANAPKFPFAQGVK